MPGQDITVLVGSFCAPIKKFLVDAKGLFHYQGDVESSGPAPSYIIQSPCKRYMYCTLETMDATTSQVMSFRCIDFETYNFEFLSSQSSGGGAPCFLSVDEDNSYLFASNYFGGNVTVFPIKDGVLSPFCQMISFNFPVAPHIPLNRASGHCHQTVHLSKSQSILVCELGQNAIYTFKFSPQPECSTAHEVLKQTGVWVAPPHSGPRHLVVHPSEKYVYVLSELSCTVMVLLMDSSTGEIISKSYIDDDMNAEPPKIYSTLREDERDLPPETIAAAEILLSDDSRYLYISNRDVDVDGRDVIQDKFEKITRCSIAVFAVQNDGASLQPIQQVHSLGCHPRAMTFLRKGSCLAIGNKDEGYHSLKGGGNLVVFPIDRCTGMLLIDEVAVSEDMEVEVTQPTWIHPLYS